MLRIMVRVMLNIILLLTLCIYCNCTILSIPQIHYTQEGHNVSLLCIGNDRNLTWTRTGYYNMRHVINQAINNTRITIVEEEEEDGYKTSRLDIHNIRYEDGQYYTCKEEKVSNVETETTETETTETIDTEIEYNLLIFSSNIKCSSYPNMIHWNMETISCKFNYSSDVHEWNVTWQIGDYVYPSKDLVSCIGPSTWAVSSYTVPQNMKYKGDILFNIVGLMGFRRSVMLGTFV